MGSYPQITLQHSTQPMAATSTTPDIKVEQGYKRVYIRVLKHHALEDWNMGFCIVIFIQSLFMVCR